MAKGVTMYNQSDQGCCWQPQGQHNYRRFFVHFFSPPKDTFHLLSIWRVHLYCSEMQRDMQGHLEGQQQREEMAEGGSNGQNQVTNNLSRAKKEK